MAHDIAGLIAWAKREEWRDALSELLDRHSAQACAAAGIEMEDIADILGARLARYFWCCHRIADLPRQTSWR